MKKLGARHKVMQQTRIPQRAKDDKPGIKVNDYMNQKQGAVEQITD
jgi:hypothetical protein